MKVKELFGFIRERHNVYLRRARGEPKPWTKDPILQQYRFCNVYRELDRVTIWIREHWRTPYENDPNLFFAMVVARLLNKPESLNALDVKRHVLQWDPKSFKKIMRFRKEAGEKIFSGAYMIHADRTETGLKTDYLADFVFSPIWKDRATIRPRPEDSLASFHARLMTCRDMGSFMAAQVVADMKFAPVLIGAGDWYSWAAPGPGSERGLNRVCGFPVKDGWEPSTWLQRVNRLQEKLRPLLLEAGMEPLSAQDTQNALCEFDKYSRVRLGEGRPKQLYPGV
jgi:hypothetical protein